MQLPIFRARGSRVVEVEETAVFIALVSLEHGAPLRSDQVQSLARAVNPGYAAIDVGELEPYVVAYRLASPSSTETSASCCPDPLTMSVVIGDPLNRHQGAHPQQGHSPDSLDPDDLAAWSRSRGAFVFVHIALVDGALVARVVSDKLGIRPLYYWTDGEVLVLSATLSDIERLSLAGAGLDEQGLAQSLAFGYPLGSRTKLAGVARVEAGEIITFHPANIAKTRYFDWASMESDSTDLPARTREAFRLFEESLRLRRGQEQTATAFLSGGMDSRAIVGGLVAQGVEVETLNFSPDGSQDQVLAEDIALALGCTHSSIPRSAPGPEGFRVELANLCSDLVRAGRLQVGGGRLWSGDGGSVSLGTVYLNEDIVSASRRVSIEEATRRFLTFNRIGLPVGGFVAAAREWQNEFVFRAMIRELSRIDHEDPAQRLFLFLMLNDQRRHLDDFFETQASHGLSYHLPFFDSDLLACVFAVPIDHRLCHRFYWEWFKLFDGSVRSTPWQTYPGHVPCPIPIDPGLGYQWAAEPRRANFLERAGAFRAACRYALGQASIRPVSKLRLSAAALLHLAGLRDMQYLIDAAAQSRAARITGSERESLGQ